MISRRREIGRHGGDRAGGRRAVALEAQGLDIGAHMGGIAGRGDSALRRLAAHWYMLLNHEDEVLAGAYCVFTNIHFAKPLSQWQC